MKNVKLDLLLKARNHMAEMETSSEAISTPDIIKEIDDFLNKQKYIAINGVVIVGDGKITIQRAEYIEDGRYIEIDRDKITLFEIPEFGGTPFVVSKYLTLMEALIDMDKL